MKAGVYLIHCLAICGLYFDKAKDYDFAGASYALS